MVLIPGLLLACCMTAPVQESDGTTEAFHSRITDYESKRIRLDDMLNDGIVGGGDKPMQLLAARDLLASVQRDDLAPEWYRAEIEGLVDSFERVVALPAEERNEFLSALAANPSPSEAPDECEAVHLKARALIAKHFPAGHPMKARREYYLSNLNLQLGHWEASETFMRASVATSARWHGGASPEHATSLMSLGWVERRLGRYEEARETLERAAAIFEAAGLPALPVYREEWMHLTNYRGTIAMELRDLDRAEELLTDYAKQAEVILGRESVPYLIALNNLHSCYTRRRDFSGAMAIQYECVSRAVRVLPDSDLSLIRFWFNLGSSAQSAGKPREALHAYERVIDAWDDRPIRREVLLLALSNRALIHILLGDDEAAWKSAELALAEVRSQPQVAPDLLDGILEAIIFASYRTGRIEQASELLDEYDSFASGDQHQKSALYRGLIAKARGETAEALAIWQACVEGLDDPDRLGAGWLTGLYTEIGRALLDEGRYAEATEVLQAAALRFEEERGQLLPGFGRPLTQLCPYPSLAHAAFKAGDLRAAFGAIEADSARTLADLVGVDREVEGQIEGDALTDLESQAARLREHDGTGDALGEEGDRAVADKLRELDARMLALRSSAARAAQTRTITPLSIEELQLELESDEALIGWFDLERVGGRGAIVWVLRATGMVEIAALPRREIDRGETLTTLLSDYCRVLKQEAVSAFAPAGTASHERAAFIGDKLFGEVVARGLLDGVHHLFVSTRGIEGIPLEALRLPTARAVSSGEAHAEWLGERWSISYAPSATLHIRLGRSSAGPPARVLVLADPLFSDHERTAIGVHRGESELPQVPETRTEAEVIAGIFKQTRLLAGEAASEAALRDLARSGELPAYSVVHIATHAIIDDADQATTRLALAQANLPDPFRETMAGRVPLDGFLTVPEIVTWCRLDADLVTLSACSSGLGVNLRGEGYVGLTSAFLQAGAKSVLSSRWKVQDEPTRLFMAEFYKQLSSLKGERRKVRALGAARQSLRSFERDGLRPFEHPAFWSAFVLTGTP